MAYFTHVTTLVGAGFVHSSGITDLEIAEIGGQFYLYSSSFADGGLAAYALGPGQAALTIGQRDYGSATGTLGIGNFSVATVNGEAVLIPAGSHDDRMVLHRLDDDGDFGAIAQMPGTSATLGHVADTEIITFGKRAYLFTAQTGTEGFGKWKIRSDLSVKELGDRGGGNSVHLGDIVDLESLQIGRYKFLLAASAFDAGLTVFEVTRTGAISFADSVGPGEFTGFSMPSVLGTVQFAGRSFVLMGAAGTDTISVYSINRTGKLVEMDVVRDSAETRFRDVAAIETFTMDGRAFVLAGGSDDGLSLFEVNPDGTLFHLASISDQLNTTLNNVTAIAAHVFGDQIQVFVTGEGDAGITQFTVDLDELGLVLKGTVLLDAMTGSAADDLIFDGRGWDHLDGGAGNDRIHDGIGKDVLTGGAGADVFVFEPDGRGDIVTDFTLGQDRIDLSGFDMLYHISGVNISKKAWGFLLTVKDENIYLYLPEGQAHQTGDFQQDDFIFG